MLLAIALPIRVFPVPGGPNKSNPFGGARAPWTYYDFHASLNTEQPNAGPDQIANQQNTVFHHGQPLHDLVSIHKGHRS